MDRDTAIGGAESRFPDTRLSAVRAASSAEPEQRKSGWERMTGSYWKPVYKYIRIRWRRSNEDAKDLTQAFFLRAMEKDFFARYDPSRARLSTFMRLCVDRFVANESQLAGRLKRGGERMFHSLTGNEPDERVHQEWLRAQFSAAVAVLRARLAPRPFAIFEAYDLDPRGKPTYRDLAARFGLKETDITNHLAAARRELRRVLNERGYGVYF